MATEEAEAPHTALLQKDAQFREYVLQGNVWRVFFHVGTPLAAYQLLGMIFKFLDTIMAAGINATAVSAVAYLSQISVTFAAVGGGLAVGASLKISEAYGAGDYLLVQKRVSSLLALCAILGGCVFVLLPFTTPLLQLVQTPAALIEAGSGYFKAEILGLVVNFFNTVYISIERARGNTTRILLLNVMTLAAKLALTAWFIYGLHADIVMLSVASILSQTIILGAAVWNLRPGHGVFSVSLRCISFGPKTTGEMVKLSVPVIVEKIVFSFGRVVVNSMSTLYGTLTVGAFNISNNICGCANTLQTGFQEGAAALISQNVGANQPRRALRTFGVSLVVNSAVGAVVLAVTLAFVQPISLWLAGGDAALAQLIANIYAYDGVGGCVPLGIIASVMALLYGFGYTKLTLLINFCRLFVFRIPVLWALQRYTALGSECMGLVMLLSNLATAVFAAVIAVRVVRHICACEGIAFSAIFRAT